MSNETQRVLTECFSLTEHPFEPKVDPLLNVNFRMMGVSLSRALDVFRVAELKDYFLQVGPFKQAVADIESFLSGPGSGGTAPAFLIEGGEGVGRSTMANYVGYLIKEQNQGAASLNTVPVPSDHFGKLLFTIKSLIALHVKQHNVPNCEAAFALFSDEVIGPQDPSVNYLSTIFAQLVSPMAVAPPLILIVESINWDRRDWMMRLYDLLSKLNIVLVFLTEDQKVYNIFQNLGSGPKLSGLAVSLDALDRQMAEEFLIERMGRFRSKPSPIDKQGLFPFASQALNGALRKNLEIKKLEVLCRGAFNNKLSELSSRFKATNGQPPNPPIGAAELVISFDDFGNYVRQVIRSSIGG
jgi:hypothetical protein